MIYQIVVGRIDSKFNSQIMWFKWGFQYFTLPKQLVYLRQHGVMLGTRVRNGRKVFLYMVKNLFVEVIYKNDNSDREAERLEVFSSLKRLNDYLEKEFRATF